MEDAADIAAASVSNPMYAFSYNKVDQAGGLQHPANVTNERDASGIAYTVPNDEDQAEGQLTSENSAKIVYSLPVGDDDGVVYNTPDSVPSSSEHIGLSTVASSV